MTTSNYILLPRRGFKAADAETRDLLTGVFKEANLRGFGVETVFQRISDKPLAVLDSTMEDGPKLVAMDDAAADAVNRTPGPLRAEPMVIYDLPRESLLEPQASTVAVGPKVAFTVHCADAATGAPLAGATVIAFDDFASRSGAQGKTDAAGDVVLQLRAGTIQRLYVRGARGYWSGYRANVPVANLTVSIPALSLSYPDAIRSLYPVSRFNAGLGVKVGVLDTGVGPNDEVNVVGGRCTVTGQQPGAYLDIAEHGTHVAGLVGGRGKRGAGVRGLAPGVEILAYRVFDYYAGRLGASNYAILKAMIRAQSDAADILNLSLGGGPRDAVVEEAIADARENGILVVVAAGNDGRWPVSYPAAYPGATAVSAMGREGTFPAGTSDEANVLRPPHNAADPADFIAAFSNVGPQIACTGLGVGVLSTLPNNAFGAMSGTSMAAPMVAGCAASLLSQDAALFGMVRDRSRSNAIERLLQLSCVRRFGNATFEGYGLPDPARV